MKCLQCKNDATETGMTNGYMVRECSDGHRTAKLTAVQEKEIINKLGVSFDDAGDVEFKPASKAKRAAAKSKGIPATMYHIFDKVENGGR